MEIKLQIYWKFKFGTTRLIGVFGNRRGPGAIFPLGKGLGLGLFGIGLQGVFFIDFFGVFFCKFGRYHAPKAMPDKGCLL